MLLSLFLVTQASILSLSFRECEFSERTRQIIRDEVSMGTEDQDGSGSRSGTLTLQNSRFRKLNGEWVCSADSGDEYWDQKWGSYNCYSYAMQRYDIVPEYYPIPDDLSSSYTRWYIPGEISSYDYPINRDMTVSEQAEAVADDFEVLGYTNVSAFHFTGVLPTLGTDEELIAVRTTGTSSDDYDFHFMRYNKADGLWYHKPGSANVLQYKHALSEQLVWTNERPSSAASVTYSSDIWLIKYTRPVLTVSVDDDLYEPLYIDNIGDKVVALDVEEAGYLELSFWNVNGFSAVLYTDDWDALGVATYNPIETDVSAGRHYLVMKNWRYSNYVYVSASLSPIAGGARSDGDCRLFVVSENERLIIGNVASGSLVELGVEPITFLNDEIRGDER